ncbi:unnamed protein product [Mytilus coruscus]|uniref:Uncharacterized protein n=1 Tax=Mytilus coruscus TaxID=42192 RepID=A0A6J8B2M6_MYTCO|nr:unnamed protein product [Mytilus coruscus]
MLKLSSLDCKEPRIFCGSDVILSSDVHVCLTWEAKKENITFKCKVSNLLWKVYFSNPENEEQGFCVSPIPVQECHSSHNVITQDLQTNTTVLVIQRHVDSKLNGPWKCSHGTNRDAAIVNVTVITKGGENEQRTDSQTDRNQPLISGENEQPTDSQTESNQQLISGENKQPTDSQTARNQPLISGENKQPTDSQTARNQPLISGENEQPTDSQTARNQPLISGENEQRTDSQTESNQPLISGENEQPTDSQTARNQPLLSKENLVAEKNKSEEEE